jgi:hypothetical protein
VQTVGALAIAIGASLGIANRRRPRAPETIVLGVASCTAFGLASIRASQTESRAYLGDAILEIAFLTAWLEPYSKLLRLVRRVGVQRSQPRNRAPSPRPTKEVEPMWAGDA